MTRVIAIDPGITRTGVAIFHTNGAYLENLREVASCLLDAGLIRPAAKGSHPERYGDLADGIREIARQWRTRDVLAVVELPTYAGRYDEYEGATYQSIEILNRAIGAIIAALRMEGVTVIERPASKVAKSVRTVIVNAALKKAGKGELKHQDAIDAIYLGFEFLSGKASIQPKGDTDALHEDPTR